MSSESASSSLQAALDAYLDDAMGVRFDALARFATPLFDLYGIDLQASCIQRSENRPPGELNALITALDTARLFWSYFSLDENEQQRHAPALKKCLIGAAPAAEAEASFHELMELMRDQWDALPASLRNHACDSVPSTLPPFEKLIDTHTAPAKDTPPGASAPDPSQTEQPEALALFAQPLLDDPAVHVDPDALEARMARATAYWDLAHTPPDAREQKLEALLQRFADSPDERERLQQEARDMLDRFEELFPEQAS